LGNPGVHSFVFVFCWDDICLWETQGLFHLLLCFVFSW
jgi:hypothetical protein